MARGRPREVRPLLAVGDRSGPRFGIAEVFLLAEWLTTQLGFWSCKLEMVRWWFPTELAHASCFDSGTSGRLYYT